MDGPFTEERHRLFFTQIIRGANPVKRLLITYTKQYIFHEITIRNCAICFSNKIEINISANILANLGIFKMCTIYQRNSTKRFNDIFFDVTVQTIFDVFGNDHT